MPTQQRAPEVQQVGDYYASGMDEKTIESVRTKPLEDELKRIDAIKDRSDLLKAIARSPYNWRRRVLPVWLGPGRKGQHTGNCSGGQGGLGLPDRDYYIKTDEDSKKKRAAYIEHVTKMLTLMGETPGKAAENAQKIMASRNVSRQGVAHARRAARSAEEL